MAEIKIAQDQDQDPNGDPCQDRRFRGRPQVRPDCDTRQVIYEAARHEFADNGYAATSIERVARRAGVSTRTLYRLIPNKASLFEGMVSDRLDRTLANVDLQAIDHAAARLGNTRTVCRKYYIHPVIIAAYLDGEVLQPSRKHSKKLPRKPGGRLRKHEEEVLAFIKARLPERVILSPKAEARDGRAVAPTAEVHEHED